MKQILVLGAELVSRPGVVLLLKYGKPMARTVSLPLAMGVKLIAEEKIKLTGVQIPIKKEIYNPVLDGIAQLGIGMEEKRVC